MYLKKVVVLDSFGLSDNVIFNEIDDNSINCLELI